ncbi:MAG: hypothetical protein JWQ66_1101 [Mucilaginibacter sp.]|nr:hypothetical protein [Mucilaginibacter sp.]
MRELFNIKKFNRFLGPLNFYCCKNYTQPTIFNKNKWPVLCRPFIVTYKIKLHKT